jgi:steroid delta-isomerase-like uncharacterized protein
MSTKENKELVRHVVDLWNRRELDAFFRLLAPGYIEHLPTGDIHLNQLKEYAREFFTAFPDIQFTIEDIIAEGDRVAAFINWKGTHRGTYMGIPATGKKIDITNAVIVKIAAGKWAEFWNVTDMRLIQQLGVIPEQ